MRPLAIVLMALSALLVSAPSVRATSVVPAGFQRVAADHGIPSDVFYAVALAESGKRIEHLRELRPWPWTLNVHGDGRFYPSRRAATLALREALATGRRSVDIGLMQVNWRYHQKALGELDEALAPYRNLRVAAAILTTCYKSRRDWWAAVGCYHAPNNPHRAERYRERVRTIWHGIAGAG